MKRYAVCLLTAGALFASGCAEKPVLGVVQAQQSLAAARDAEADFYAPEEYDLAATNLQNAIVAIEEEDQERVWERNYDLAAYLLELSIEQSEAAIEIADTIRLDVAFQAELLIPQVQEAIEGAFAELERARRTNVVSRGVLDGLDADLVYSSQLLASARESQQRADQVAAVDQAQQAIDLADAVRTRSEEINLYAIEVELELELQQQAIPVTPDAVPLEP